jgi:hypothetical protein
LSEQQRKEAEQAQAEAKLSAEKFEKVFQATEPKLPQAPTGRRPEDIPHREIPVKNLEKKTIAPETGKPQTLRDVLRRRYGQKKPGGERVRVVRQSPNVRASRGAPVYPKGRPFESSGRISTELTPAKAERLALVRERVRAVQNRRELSTLEKLYRRFRAQYPHDPELRP